MNWLKRNSRPRWRATVNAQPGLAAVRDAANEAAYRGWEALDRLVEALAELDAGGDDGLGRAALGVLGGLPKVVARLDEHARRVLWYSSYSSPALNRVAKRLDAGSAGPVAVALASTHGNGRVRERAVAAMLARPCPELMPLLVLRTGDWVAPVRDRARSGLALLLGDDPRTYLPAVLPVILLVQPRLRGGFAYTQAVAALVTAPTDVRQTLTVSADRRQRRFVFDIAMGQGWLPLDALVAAAESDDDVRIRVRAAEAACREAVWTRRVGVLQRLVGSRRAEVRVVALTGLVRLGHDADVAGYLDDDAPLVRAVARDAARRLGVDFLAHYRAAVTAPVPAAGAIAGLAETGSATDAHLLRPLLAYASGRVRAVAVRGLRRLDAVDVDEMVPRLRDPSPSVVREATAALKPLQRRVPVSLCWELLADPRVELRRAGYRLLRGRSAAVHLRTALILAGDPDAGLAWRGRADATRLARDAGRPTWRRAAPSDLHVTAAEQAELAELVHQAAGALGDGTASLLTVWLSGTTPVARSVS